MNKLIAGLGLALALVGTGCGGSQKGSAAKAAAKEPAESPCVPMARHLADTIREAGKQAGDTDGAGMAAMIDTMATVSERVVAERCQADAWSTAMIDCVQQATIETMEACDKQLTDAQRSAMEAQMKRELEAAGTAPGGPAAEDEGGGTEKAAPPPPDDPCGGGA